MLGYQGVRNAIFLSCCFMACCQCSCCVSAVAAPAPKYKDPRYNVEGTWKIIWCGKEFGKCYLCKKGIYVCETFSGTTWIGKWKIQKDILEIQEQCKPYLTSDGVTIGESSTYNWNIKIKKQKDGSFTGTISNRTDNRFALYPWKD